MDLKTEYKLGDKPVTQGLSIKQILTDKFEALGDKAGVFNV